MKYLSQAPNAAALVSIEEAVVKGQANVELFIYLMSPPSSIVNESVDGGDSV